MENNRAWVLLGRKMTGEAAPEELAELDRLIRDDPGVQYSLEVITGLWKECKEKMNAAEVEGYYERHFARLMAVDPAISLPVAEKEPEPVPEYPGFEEPRRKSRRALSMAAILVAVMVTGAGLYGLLGRKPHQLMARLNEVSTKNGSKSKVVLPDGTQVWLNSGSKLAYANDLLNEATREVTLSGEAFFEVVHDENHPFIIHTQSIDIRDIGTRFNVRSYPGDLTTETTLIEGSVEISFHKNPAEKIILKPNQKITLYNEELKEDTQVTPSDVTVKKDRPAEIFRLTKVAPDPVASMIADTAWMANRLIFQSENFTALAAQLERWFNVRIEFRNEAVKQYKFTGVFENETITQALEALRITGSFKYKIYGDTVLISK